MPPKAIGSPSRLTVSWYELACRDRDGDHHGPAVTFWPTGRPYSDGAWDHGLQTGTWSYYYDTGELFARGTYREGIADPGWTYRQRDGKPLFWDKGGAGCPAGTHVTQDPAAAPSIDYWCEKPGGIKHGPAVSWRGLPGWMFTQYRDGKEHGRSVRWGEDRIRYERVYDDGWHVSETLYYGDHPFEYRESLKANGGDGREHGVARTWYPDGTIESEGTNYNGGRHGTWTYYDPTGTPVARATYDHTKLVSREDLWHCLDAQHLLRPADLGAGVTATRIRGEAERADYSTVQLHGRGKDASLRLWKSNFDDSQGIFLWVINDLLRGVDYMRDEDAPFWWSKRGTFDRKPALAFMDIKLGAIVMVTGQNHDEAVKLARVAHHRLLYERWCVEVKESKAPAPD